MSPVPEEQGEISLRSAGQRRVNILWERTQAVIAVSVTGSALIASILLVRWTLVITDPTQQVHPLFASMVTGAFVLLSNLANLVIGFYFGRSNHARTGGIGGGSVTEER